MPEVKSYEPGMPAWTDLSTADPTAARRFYAALFDWDIEVAGPETGGYSPARRRGLTVAGLAGEPVPAGVPTAWTVYLATDNVDAAARRVKDHGGEVVAGPMDVLRLGRTVIASDPSGAMFGLWQAGGSIGASLVDEPGAATWHELRSRDLAAAQEFYTKVVGYDWQAVDTGEGGAPYQRFLVNGHLAGGALQLSRETAADTPSQWLVYFQVDDSDAATATGIRLGGRVHEAPRDSQFGRRAVLSDPQGAVFAVLSPPRTF